MTARTRQQLSVALALVAGLALRWYLAASYSQVAGDALNYGDLAKNIVLHHVYGYTSGDGVRQTIIRLPGYPLFMAAIFRLFGVEHYAAIIRAQVVVDLASCVLIASAVRRWMGDRAAHIALWLACLCPFTADYAVAPLTETLSIFCVSLALAAYARLYSTPKLSFALFAFIFAVSYAALLRPDGALLGVTLFPALLYAISRHRSLPSALAFTAATAFITLLPFVAWAVRNERVFHVFQPLAPRYATEVGEYVPRGFTRWTATWCADFASTSEFFWNLDGSTLDIDLLPARAFDSPAQHDQTAAILDDYNQDTTLTPELDARFAALANGRTSAHPARTYLVLPVARLADMWLRPRIEMLPIDVRWWNYEDDPGGTRFAWAYGALNAIYLLAAGVGFIRALRERAPAWMLVPLVTFVVLRCALLLTLETPEPRYTLECFPMVFAFAALAFSPRAKAPAVSA